MNDTLTIEQAENIVAQLEDLGIWDVQIREDYSGRCMYGETCVAFVFDGTISATHLGYAAALADVPFEAIPSRQDSMGLGTVLY